MGIRAKRVAGSVAGGVLGYGATMGMPLGGAAGAGAGYAITRHLTPHPNQRNAKTGVRTHKPAQTRNLSRVGKRPAGRR